MLYAKEMFFIDYKLTQDFKGIRDELEKTVQSSYSHFDQDFDSPGIQRGTRKRSNPVKTPSPTKRLRRENANTPTRQFLSTTVAHGEPAVAVMSTSWFYGCDFYVVCIRACLYMYAYIYI